MTSRPRRKLAVVVAALAASGCLYSLSGGGGLPEHIDTMYVPPVQNETSRFALTERLTQSLLEAVRGRLGAQVASQENADGVIRVTLTGYDDQAMSFEAREGVGAEVFQRRVTLVARVEIVDLARDRTLFSSSVRGTGEYAPEEETEEAGIDLALENLLQQIVDGAQSQW